MSNCALVNQECRLFREWFYLTMAARPAYARIARLHKRLPHVLAAHGSTIRILHTLTPLVVAMAGANAFHPCKD
jgi:hypothetical protein